jgi:hypothetical protein
VRPEHVIGETLQRATPARDLADPQFVAALRERIADTTRKPPRDWAGFVADPLSIWIESTFGVRQDAASGRMVRAKPRAITGDDGAARELSRLTGVAEERCVAALQDGLLAGYTCEPNPQTGFPPFAFRLHQFISRGDLVYASLEPEAMRHITLQGQQFVPGDRTRVLLPLVFCRECGQEYYCVWETADQDSGRRAYTKRDLAELRGEAGARPCFLYLSSAQPWPSDPEEVARRVPEDWVEERGDILVVRRDRRKDLPQPVRLGTDGRERDDGLECHVLGAPFRFCLRCGVEYAPRQMDFAKLATLSSEGRSTATTILSLYAVLGLQ